MYSILLVKIFQGDGELKLSRNAPKKTIMNILKIFLRLRKQIFVARILTMSGEEVEETEIDGFVDDEQTYFSGNVCNKKIVQVSVIYSNSSSVEAPCIFSIQDYKSLMDSYSNTNGVVMIPTYPAVSNPYLEKFKREDNGINIIKIISKTSNYSHK